jgi:tRNA 2-thiouridine synthesizing protein A
MSTVKRQKTGIDKVLDVKGLLCPQPTVMTSKTLKDMKKGTSLQVITNDQTTKKSIPQLCEHEGYSLLEITEREGLLYYIIRK